MQLSKTNEIEDRLIKRIENIELALEDKANK